MYALRLLGTVSLEGPDGPVEGRITERRPLACLAVLAVEGGTVTRDKLTGLLWEESSERRARHRLSDVLYLIRKALGEESLHTSGASVRLDARVVRSDVDTYLARISEDDLEGAASIYAGPLLDGFYVSGAPAFERWLDHWRRTLEQRQGAALETLGRESGARGDLTSAVFWWNQRVALEPANSRVCLRLIEALAEDGDRAGALEVGARHLSLLEEEFDLPPPPDVLAFLETLGARDGYAPRDEWRSLNRASRADRRSAARSLEPPSAPPSVGGPTSSKRRRRGRRLRSLGGPAVAVAAVAAGLIVSSSAVRPGDPAVARDGTTSARVLVLPFRVGGASASLSYLGEGMVDLLFSGVQAAAVSSVDPYPAITGWRAIPEPERALGREGPAATLARELNATHAVLGEIVGGGEEVILTARVLDVLGDSVAFRVRAAGPSDSVHALAGGLAGNILARLTGETPRLAAMLSGSRPTALRSYLEGRQAYRQGKFKRAVDHFEEALDADSTSIVAALALLEAGEWYGAASREQKTRAIDVVWRRRAKLGPGERAYVTVRAGPFLAEPLPWRRTLHAAEDAIVRIPDRPELWVDVSGIYINFGEMMGLEDVWSRSFQAVERGLELAPRNAPLLLNGFRGALVTGDRRRAAEYGRRYLETEWDLEAAEAVRWFTPGGAADARDRASDEILDVSGPALMRIPFWAVETGRDVPVVDLAVPRMLQSSTTPFDRYRNLLHWHYWALSLGRPGAAHDATESMLSSGVDQPDIRHTVDRLRVLASLYSAGDRRAALESLDRLSRRADAPVAGDAHERALQYAATCVVEQWRLWERDTGSVSESLRKLARADPELDEPGVATRARLCVTLLEAMRAHVRDAPDVETRLAALDSAMRTVPTLTGWSHGNLALARLRELRGDLEGALDVVWRRPRLYFTDVYVSRHLLEEGRLAALLGQKERATRAYEHYLALHYRAEPSLQGEVRWVRKALEGLERP